MMQIFIRTAAIARTAVIAACLLAVSTASFASTVQIAVAQLLERSARAWNRGDLDAFMTTYENSPQTVYITSTTIVCGYTAIRARYAAHYRPGEMGTLSVSDLNVRPLGAAYALASARWHLTRSKSKGGNVSGLFTLVLRHGAGGWHIIADHTP